MQKDPSVGCLLLSSLIALSLVVIAGGILAWLSFYVGYPVHWAIWSWLVTTALWATFEVADS